MARGYHILADCLRLSADVLSDDARIMTTLVRAAFRSGANVIGAHRYRFGANSPSGCTVIVMLDESHVSVHTYALEGRAAIDIFTCGERADTLAESIWVQIKSRLCISTVAVRRVSRFTEEENGGAGNGN